MSTITQEQAKERLEYLRGELNAERISYEELAELHDLIRFIEPGDVQLLEAAGVPEFPEGGEEDEDDDKFDIYSIFVLHDNGMWEQPNFKVPKDTPEAAIIKAVGAKYGGFYHTGLQIDSDAPKECIEVLEV